MQVFESGCLHEGVYEKSSLIMRMGDIAQDIGIVASGSVIVESVDMWGNRVIVDRVSPGCTFADAYTITGKRLMVEVVAAERTTILFIRRSLLGNDRFRRETWYVKIVENLLSTSSTKNTRRSEQIFILAHSSARLRIMAYLSSVALAQGRPEVDIPFNRGQMAEYLNLNRSALSRELANMRNEGLIDFQKNHFVLHFTPAGAR